MMTPTETNGSSNNKHNDMDEENDDDLSSLGDTSPLQATQAHHQKRLQKCRRNVTLSFIFVYVLVYNSLSSNPMSTSSITTVDKDFKALNNTDLWTFEIQHTQHLASNIARIYRPVPPSVWCIDGRLKAEQGKRRPMGLSYLKIPRAASTTLAGVNQRIAKNFAHRQDLPTSCIRHDGHVPGMYYSKRDPLSYLWTFVRDPSSRAMSRVARTLSKPETKPTRSNSTKRALNISTVLQTLKTSRDVQFGAISMGRGGFQLQYSMLTIIDKWSAWNTSDPTRIINPRQVQRHVQQVIEGYDFIGVVERLDESLVALQLLLGLETSDILHFSSHTSPLYERRQVPKKADTFVCQQPLDWRPLMKANPSLQSYLTSPEWFAENYGDYLLYQAANQSLDRTIMRLGLDVFSIALKEFRSLQQHAHEVCHPIFPCSLNGTDQWELSQTNCYFDDVGCGYPCLDELATAAEV